MVNKSINIARQAEAYDAIVVGSGITGGWAAKELCEKGLKTLVLERGRDVKHGEDYITEHQKAWEMPHRGRPLSPELVEEKYFFQGRHGLSEANAHFYIRDDQNPYVEADNMPFSWIRGDQVGGRSLTWGRQSYRWSDLDFEANARDGFGVDWPIRYADLAPWYSYVEQFIGVSGRKENMPQLPDGEFLPPMAFNAGEVVLKEKVEAAFPERRITIGRSAVLTQPHNGRGACHYCGPCSRGCSAGAYFSSQSSTLPAARATGNLTLRPDSIVHSVIYDEEQGRARGIRFIDRESGEMEEVYAKVVFLCASTLGSTQVMLNSTSSRFPNGIANDSGALGKYLMDHHFRVGASGEMEGLDSRYYQGNRPNGIYIIRFRNTGDNPDPGLNFTRGYGFQGGANRPSWGRGAGQPGFGADFKNALRDPGPWGIWIGGWCEALPREENYVELDSEVTDAWGIPALKIHCDWGENELEMRKDVMTTGAEMLEAAGAKNISTFDNYEQGEIGAEPGLCIHEMGTARMGRDPQTSVLNGNNQAHSVPNLFVTDGACMASTACQNPSLTYMALTARAVDFATEAMKRGDV